MTMFGGRGVWGVVGMMLGMILSMTLGLAGTANAAPVALHCTNTTSGATWDVAVDLAQGTVDSVPARITDGAISWEDTTLHFYDYNRRTGQLDMHAASSTGGFYLTDRCVFK